MPESMPPPREFQLEEFHHARERRLLELDASLPSAAFSDDVRKSLYKFALIRNSWGTTNLDSGPIELEQVNDLYERYVNDIPRHGRIPPTEREVLNYFQLVGDLPTSAFPISLDDVEQLHRDYFRDVPLQNDARPGQLKTRDNAILGPYGRVPTSPHADARRDLADLLRWLNEESAGFPTHVRAALFFHEFQRIHPFGDGNGRLGRLLTLWVLSTGGLSSVRYCPIDDEINLHREEYYRYLNAADHGDLKGWVGYFGAQVLSGYQRAHLLGRRLQLVPNSVGPESRRLLEHLYIHHVETFRVADVKSFYLGLSESTITRRLKDLEQLRLVTGLGRGAGRRYAVSPPHAVETTRPGSAS